MNKVINEENIRKLLIITGIVFMLTFCLGIFAYMVIISFSSRPDFLSNNSQFVLELNNYKSVLTSPSLHFLAYLRNSFIVSVSAGALGVFIAALTAYAITRLPLPGKIFILLFILTVSMFPQISIIGYLFKIMTNLNWINTYKALVIPYIAWILPLSVWILVSYFSQIPRELDKSALVDGCNRWQILFKIIFPIARPGIFSVFLLAFIFSFNEFIFALMLTTDHTVRTIPVGIALFQGLHGEIPWGTIMAASSITTLPIVIITFIFQRHIIGGLTRGAVKG